MNTQKQRAQIYKLHLEFITEIAANSPDEAIEKGEKQIAYEIEKYGFDYDAGLLFDEQGMFPSMSQRSLHHSWIQEGHFLRFSSSVMRVLITTRLE